MGVEWLPIVGINDYATTTRSEEAGALKRDTLYAAVAVTVPEGMGNVHPEIRANFALDREAWYA